MKQKLAIARAMLPAPPLVFLDEPTAGLDPEAVVSLRRDIAGLASEHGVTVFLNTHNITDAEKLSDLVGVMRRGRLLAMGTPAELQGDTIVTIVGTGMSPEHAEAIGATLVEGGLSMRLRAGGAWPRWSASWSRAASKIEEVRKERAGLESTFLALVSKEAP